MAPWAHIAKPLFLHCTVNIFKMLIGAGFVGYGVALALLPLEDDDDDENGASSGGEKEAVAKENSEDEKTRFIRKCVTVTATIGFGLFLSIPSLASQVVWETVIPGITATDVAYDIGTENVMGLIPKWNLRKPKLSLPSKEEIVGELMGKAGVSTVEK
mmetsp:Transcript_14044/g.29010  ORF Transcript_14044/g.29010 Transcript_14044/m.29010 type:complete len:158 (-) Transcript_14044:217-690(-)